MRAVRHGLLPLLIAGCSATRSLEPLEPGSVAITASLGGPINSDLGMSIPLPISSVGVMYGLDGTSNIYGAFYPSGVAFFGVPGFDVGYSRQVLEAKKGRPRIMVDGAMYGFFGDNTKGDPPIGARLWLDGSATFVWPWKKHSIYGKVDLFVQPGPELHAYVNPHIGGQVRFGRVGLQIEYSWWGPWVDTQFMQPVWRGPGGFGASTIQLGFDVRIDAQGGEK